MKVYFFSVRSLKTCPINKLYKEFGKNIPHYLPLEGGPVTYLFCLDMDPYDILAICRKNDYEIVGYDEYFEELFKEKFIRRLFTEKEVDANQYNSEHIATPNYSGKQYELESIDLYKGSNFLKSSDLDL
jgi:hypothetical protein